MIVKPAVLIVFFICTCCNCFAQKKKNNSALSNVSATDFDVSGFNIIDSNTAAVILYESGYTRFIGNKKDWFSHVYTCTRRIKILNKSAFDLATIKIALYSDDGDAEILSDLNAVTYNLNNGMVVPESLSKEAIFSDQVNKNVVIKKFALPAINEGSIIEYSYTITSNYNFNLPSWYFQTEKYPVLWSEYKVSIPSNLTYVAQHQGFDSFYIKKFWKDYENYEVTKPRSGSDSYGTKDIIMTVGSETNNFYWVEKNVSPLKPEPFISSPKNYIDKIEFQLSGIYDGEDKHDVLNNWLNVSKALMQQQDFQDAVVPNSWIKDEPGFTNEKDELTVAKNIYHYLQNNFTCTDTSDIIRETDLFKVYTKKQGSVRAINLLLIAMLNNKNIYAEPLLLSTKENGFVSPYYSFITKYNYLICRAVINGESYLLDATNSAMGFGNLPVKCYNGYAKVVSSTKSDSIYLSSDSLKDFEISTLVLTNNKNNVSGTYKCVMGKIQSAQIRRKMQTTSKEDYFKSIKANYDADVHITNQVIDSFEEKELPVSVKYDLLFTPAENILYFNPMMANAEKENPFKAAKKNFPVALPYSIDKVFILTMEIPSGYTVVELPKPARISLNNNEGMFEYLIQQSAGAIQLRCRTQIKKANFLPEDYQALRDFYTFIVEKESEQIVYKKK